MRRLIALLLWLPGCALAHTLAPSLLEIRHTTAAADHEYQVLLRQDIASAPLELLWPQDCEMEDARLERQQRQLDQHFELSCDQALEGRTLQVQGLRQDRSALILRQQLGTDWHQQLIQADQSQLQLARAPAASFPRYLILGVEHILIGWDHLLLVLGLFWLASGYRQMLILATAFTLGHSLTLAAAALGWLALPVALVEWCIAMTLLWLALRMDAPPQMQSRQAAHRELIIISAFGLIHGLGFASALSEIGLPRDAILTALLAFNLGIELGQIALLALLLLMQAIARRLNSSAEPALRLISAYSIGGLACLWGIERSLLLLK